MYASETRAEESLEPRATDPTEGRGPGIAKRLLPLGLLAALAAAAWFFGLADYLTFEALRTHRETLLALVEDHAVLTIGAFVLLYAISTAVSLPGATFLTISGGFLFGATFGTLWSVLGATLGATAVFLVARSALGDLLRRRAGPFLQRMETGFQENAFSYLLVLRLIPLFPFFVVNLVPAFLGVRLGTYIAATLIGIIPGGFVFASVGAGLGSFFARNEDFTLSGILTPEIVTALFGLALLSLLPVAYKRFRRTQAAG